jgi:long-chain acyl-CoA synthetase
MYDENATILGLFVRRVAEDEARPAIHIKRGGAFQPLTWGQLADDVRRAAAALVRLGAAPGDRVVQVSENRYEWIVIDLAVQMAGAVHTPIHSPLTGCQIAWQIRHSGAKIVLISTADQARKLAEAADEIPADASIFAFDSCDFRVGRTPFARGATRPGLSIPPKPRILSSAASNC